MYPQTVEDELDMFQFSKINLAEVAGFGPANAGVKVLCLTAWRHPNKLVTRLVPSRQCLSTVKRPTALLACVCSLALAALHAVKKGGP